MEALLRVGGGGGQGRIRREGTSETAPEAVGQAVGGGYCRLQMPLKPALAVRETVAGHRLGALEGVPPPLPMHPWGCLRAAACSPQEQCTRGISFVTAKGACGNVTEELF